MGLRIQTTGLEQYAPGGKARVKALVIGGPGVGKTRWSSYFPRPLYANCEGGLASVADRKVQFVDVANSKNMLDLLVELDSECKRPQADRHFDTIVIDTLDAFSRKVQDEWLLKNPNEQTFRGFEAWGYLEAKLQMLLTRLLNLDMNVIVLVHYMDKLITEGTGNDAVQRREYQLQLSGKVKDQVFNDFDLVGWMDTHYEAVNGKRTLKRSLTFKPTPDKPFLKDRLNATPDKLEVQFAEDDYINLFSSIISRLDEFAETEDFGEIPSADDGIDPVAPVAPESIPGGGALPPITPAEIPLVQHDRTTLAKMARDLGLKLPGNTLKSEYVAAIEEFRKAQATETAQPEPEPEVVSEPVETPAEAPAPEVTITINAADPEKVAAVMEKVTPRPVVQDLVQTEDEGVINPETGEVVEEPTTMAEAVENVQNVIGAEVLESSEPTPEPVAAEAVPEKKKVSCEVCGKDLAKENPDLVTLAWIKSRKRLCNDDWATERQARGSLK